MKTAVVTVGKEILTGRTVNTNLTTIARALQTLSIDVSHSVVIDDTIADFEWLLPLLTQDLIIFTGGLGPTIDDITRETVLSYFGVPTFVDSDILDRIRSYFERTNRLMMATNDKQALRPVDSIVLHNARGTAPGLYFKTPDKRIVLLPGPPHEMIPMLDEVIEHLRHELDIRLYRGGFKLVGTGESFMEAALVDFYGRHKQVAIAPYAGIGEIKYVFTSDDETALNRCMEEFQVRFRDVIYGSLEDTLEGVVVSLLRQKGYLVSAAESCTGGLLSATLVNVPGSSDVFQEGLVVYHNDAKRKYLNVPASLLATEGAVSEACVRVMSEQLQAKTNADVTIAISGIAGPTGGTPDKPVGLVHFGLCHHGRRIHTSEVFNGDRQMVRQRAVIVALNLLRKELLHHASDRGTPTGGRHSTD